MTHIVNTSIGCPILYYAIKKNAVECVLIFGYKGRKH